jgi:addiction module RelB/DinJ family antitoxin
MKIHEDVRVTMRVDKDLKEQAEILFGRLGMNMTTAFNVFLRKAVDEAAIPFPVSLKSTGFGGGYTPEAITAAFTEAVMRDVEESKRGGLPVAKYDAAKKAAYLESPDGTREYING